MSLFFDARTIHATGYSIETGNLWIEFIESELHKGEDSPKATIYINPGCTVIIQPDGVLVKF